MELKIATAADIEASYDIILQARAFLKSCGVDQWQKDYPNRDNIVTDINEGKGVVLLDGQAIVGFACVDFDGEPAYDDLKGEWLDQKPYAVVHRLAVSDQYKGKGIAQLFFREIEKFVKERKIDTIRIDTDDNNAIMKHLLESGGYIYCGTIWFDNSVKIAYQKQF